MTVFRPSLPTSLSTPSPPFQMNDDALIIHNGIAMNEEEMKELETLGTPTVLIVPKISHMRDVMVSKKWDKRKKQKTKQNTHQQNKKQNHLDF